MEKTDAYYLLTGDFNTILPIKPNITLGSWLVKLYLHGLMKECAELSIFSIDVFKSCLTAKLYGNDVRFLFYRRYRNGKLTRTVLGGGEYLDKGLCPREFLDLFKETNEVLIASNCHNTD